ADRPPLDLGSGGRRRCSRRWWCGDLRRGRFANRPYRPLAPLSPDRHPGRPLAPLSPGGGDAGYCERRRAGGEGALRRRMRFEVALHVELDDPPAGSRALAGEGGKVEVVLLRQATRDGSGTDRRLRRGSGRRLPVGSGGASPTVSLAAARRWGAGGSAARRGRFTNRPYRPLAPLSPGGNPDRSPAPLSPGGSGAGGEGAGRGWLAGAGEEADRRTERGGAASPTRIFCSTPSL